jgi:hypothetical protein
MSDAPWLAIRRGDLVGTRVWLSSVRRQGEASPQYAYQLESLQDINARVAIGPFAANAQGANIGLSALTAINDHEFLVMERDNRGFGVDDAARSVQVATKRVYQIDVTGATDVSRISMAESNELPVGVVPVRKTLFLDVAAELRRAGSVIPEKIEGLAIGPQLADGSHELLLASDNDFSVTQNDTNIQFDVCTDGKVSLQIPIDAGCPQRLSLIPTFLLSFKTDKSLTFPSKSKHLSAVRR